MYSEKFMLLAVEEAKIALERGEVPIGCVITKNGDLISKSHNTKELNKNAIEHGEINALIEAQKIIGDWRLNDCDIYTTCEPCIMCTGAILHTRLKKVYFGVKEPKYGGIISQTRILDITTTNHKTDYEYGFFEKDIKALMESFFLKLRKNKN